MFRVLSLCPYVLGRTQRPYVFGRTQRFLHHIRNVGIIAHIDAGWFTPFHYSKSYI